MTSANNSTIHENVVFCNCHDFQIANVPRKIRLDTPKEILGCCIACNLMGISSTPEYRKAWTAKWREKNREHLLEYGRAYAARNKEKIKEKRNAPHRKLRRRDYNLQKAYGISFDRFSEIFFAQGSVCAICKTDKPTRKGWCLDHDHLTGAPRGVLCANCNSALGWTGDSIANLQAAIEYLNIYSVSIRTVPERS